MPELLATGYPSLDHITGVSRCAGPGETALVESVLEEPTATHGGCGANVAVGVQRLGLSAGVALVLGDDSGGRAYRAALAAEGVDMQNVALLPGQRTSRSYLFRSPDGEYQNFFYPGAADAWRGDLVLTGLSSVRLALIAVGYLPYNLQFAARCAEANIPLAWQLRPDVAAYPTHALVSFAQASRLIFCNRREAQTLVEALGGAELRALFGYSVETVVITLGGDGAQVITPEGVWSVPAVRVPVVDTTGAGDAFTAGYLAGYLRGLAPDICARQGAVVASFAVEAIGCQTNLPDQARLESRMQEVFDQ
jgi:adenosine kinase